MPASSSTSSRNILVASTGRIYLRWVYLRTKWFLFGPRASCASHGGFVAAIAAAWRKRVRQANKSKDAPRVGGELLHVPPLLGLSQPSLLHPWPSRVCVCATVRAYACDLGTSRDNSKILDLLLLLHDNIDIVTIYVYLISHLNYTNSMNV